MTQLQIPGVEAIIADRDSWSTPDWLWRIPLELHERDQYTIDPCSNRWTTVPAVVRIMPPQDGLSSAIRILGGVARNLCTLAWLNPPYSDVSPWFELAVELVQRFSASIYGVIPHAPDIRAWSRHGPIRTWSLGRVDFEPPPGIPRAKGGTQEHDLALWQPWNRYPPSEDAISRAILAAGRPVPYAAKRKAPWSLG